MSSSNSWILPLAYTKPPLSLNDDPPASKGGRIAKTKRVRGVRQHARELAEAAHIPTLQRWTCVLNYRPRDNRARDAMNLYATFKPLVDGLVEAGVAAGDDRRYFVDTPPVIHDAITGEPGRMWLEVIDLTEPQQPTEET